MSQPQEDVLLRPDRKMELLVSQVLRAGVSIASAVVLAGGIAYLVVHGRERVAYHAFRGSPSSDRSILAIFENEAAHPTRFLIQLGVVLLILTPVARVVISLVDFIRLHDRVYAVISAIVLAILVYGLAHAS